MTRRRLLLLAAMSVGVFSATLTAPRASKADIYAYVAGSKGEFGTMDITTGAYTNIATFNFGSAPSGTYISGIGYGSDGNLYATDFEGAGNNSHLYLVNTTTGGLTDEGSTGQVIYGSTVNNGIIYGITYGSSGNLVSFDPTAGPTASVLASLGVESQGLVAFSGSTLYTDTGSDTATNLNLASFTGSSYTYNDLGATGYAPDTGLFIGGTFYAFDAYSPTILTLNTSTGVATSVGSYSLGDGGVVYGVALVPEPSSLILCGVSTVGMGAVALARRRRKASLA